MNTAKIYLDSEGNECSIHQMVKREPQWAATAIQQGEKALALLAELKDWDIENYTKKRKYSIPLKVREKIQKLVT